MQQAVASTEVLRKRNTSAGESHLNRVLCTGIPVAIGRQHDAKSVNLGSSSAL